MKDTTTQLLKRIDKKLDAKNACPITEKEYDEHCEFINEAKIILPQFTKAIASFEKALKQGEKTFIDIGTRLTVIETEKKTAIAIIGIVGGCIGGALSLLVSLLVKLL